MATFNWLEAGGSWSTPTNWGNVSLFPQAIDDVATFGLATATAGTRFISLGNGATRTVGTLNMTSTSDITYVLTSGGGSSTLAFDVSSGNAQLNVTSGSASPIVSLINSTVNISLQDKLALSVAGGSTRLQIDGVISGAQGIVKSGTGSLTLFGTNTFSGGIRTTGNSENSGIVDLGNAGGLGTGEVTVDLGDSLNIFARGTMTAANALTQLAASTLGLVSQGGGTLTFTGAYSADTGGNTTTLDINAPVSGSGGKVIWNPSSAVVTGGGSAFRLLVSGGELELANGTLENLTGFGGETFIGSGSVLDLNGNNLAVSRLAGSGIIRNDGIAGSTLTMNHAGTSQYAGSIQDGAAIVILEKREAGTQILTGSNTHSGSTTIFDGTLILQGFGSITNSTIEIRNGAVFDVTGANGNVTVENISFVGSSTLNIAGKSLTLTQGALSSGSSGIVNGSLAGVESLTINGTAGFPFINLSGLTFANWTDGQDSILLNGNLNAADSITGSSKAELIRSGDENGLAGMSDTIFGGDGNDTISGGFGSDSLDGGNGTDMGDFSFNNVPNLGFGVQWNMTTGEVGFGAPSPERAFNFENAVMGNGNDSVTGTSGANNIAGNGGNDTLNGGAGADQLTGGPGDDVFLVDNIGDFTTEATGEGTDTVVASISHTLRANIENLRLSGTSDTNGTGNTLTNLLLGNAGNNILDGGTGGDAMRGGAGNDRYTFDNAGDTASELVGEGLDTVIASVAHTLRDNFENLTIIGSATNAFGSSVANILTGNALANILNGREANDIMTGGAGIDTFMFDTALNAVINIDRITDFNPVDDVFRLGATIFTGISTGVVAASAFHLGTSAADDSDRIIYNQATGQVFYDADGLGGTTQVLFAVLDTKPANVTSADFVVI